MFVVTTPVRRTVKNDCKFHCVVQLEWQFLLRDHLYNKNIRIKAVTQQKVQFQIVLNERTCTCNPTIVTNAALCTIEHLSHQYHTTALLNEVYNFDLAKWAEKLPAVKV